MSAKQLFDFMQARHYIYLARKAGISRERWTRDKILRTYRFCNVYRELDTVTIWIDQFIRKPFAEHDMLWFMLCIARRINWPPTLQELMDRRAWPVKNWNPDLVEKVLDARTERGEQVYTGAYMITAETGPEHTGKTKSHTTAFSSLDKLYQNRREIEPRLHDTLGSAYISILGQGFAWGPFMTYEVVTDLRHTRYLNKAADIMTWANAGPGAKRGLNRVAGRDVKKPVHEDQAVAEMQELLKKSKTLWPNDRDYPRLEMRDIEHSLCEFDKYERVRLGEGRPRSKFTPYKE